jgi:hypothetical protein
MFESFFFLADTGDKMLVSVFPWLNWGLICVGLAGSYPSGESFMCLVYLS